MILLDKKLKPLSNVFQSILCNVSGSVTRLHQRKRVHNVKHISVHLSFIYASSVSELVKPLTVSKLVYFSNASKRNVCNASNICQFIKPLNVNKLVCSNNTTNRKSTTPVVLVSLLSH